MLPPAFVNQPTEPQLVLWRKIAGDVNHHLGQGACVSIHLAVVGGMIAIDNRSA
jgi:hypothetical protein